MLERFLGIDYGEKRVGLALSDPLGLTAQPMGFVLNKQALTEIPALVEKHQIKKIILGLPRNMNGTYGPAADKVKEFSEKLKVATAATTAAEIIFIDERLTTREAEKFLIDSGLRREKRKEVIDAQAAVLILKTFMEQNKAGQKQAD